MTALLTIATRALPTVAVSKPSGMTAASFLVCLASVNRITTASPAGVSPNGAHVVEVVPRATTERQWVSASLPALRNTFSPSAVVSARRVCELSKNLSLTQVASLSMGVRGRSSVETVSVSACLSCWDGVVFVAGAGEDAGLLEPPQEAAAVARATTTTAVTRPRRDCGFLTAAVRVGRAWMGDGRFFIGAIYEATNARTGVSRRYERLSA